MAEMNVKVSIQDTELFKEVLDILKEQYDKDPSVKGRVEALLEKYNGGN